MPFRFLTILQTSSVVSDKQRSGFARKYIRDAEVVLLSFSLSPLRSRPVLSCLGRRQWTLLSVRICVYLWGNIFCLFVLRRTSQIPHRLQALDYLGVDAFNAFFRFLTAACTFRKGLQRLRHIVRPEGIDIDARR